MEELRNINAVIDRLEHAVIVAISGNHDPQLEGSAYRKIEWSRRLYLAPPGVGRVALSTYRTVITCHSWDKKEIPEPLELPPLSSRQQGSYQILMLHADTTPNSRYLPVDADALSQLGYDYVALDICTVRTVRHPMSGTVVRWSRWTLGKADSTAL